jgi:hypothetical protein
MVIVELKIHHLIIGFYININLVDFRDPKPEPEQAGWAELWWIM